VLADEFDLAIVVLPLADSRLDIHSLLTEEVLLTVGPGHRWASFASIALREVLEEPDLLLSVPGLGLRSMVDEAARDAGVELRTTFELRSQQAILALVASGGGIALSPRMSVDGRKRCHRARDRAPAEPANRVDSPQGAAPAPHRGGAARPSRRALASSSPIGHDTVRDLAPPRREDEVVNVGGPGVL
jgi:DNA-binding transcriptional LysR family regulator